MAKSKCNSDICFKELKKATKILRSSKNVKLVPPEYGHAIAWTIPISSAGLVRRSMHVGFVIM
jgi:hypothetical protein